MTRAGTCNDVAPLIDELVDGTLDGVRERAVRGHLRECSACADTAEETRALVEAASHLEALDPPPSQWETLAARLDDEEIRFSQKPRWWWWFQAWRRPLFAGGGLALAGACVLLLVLRLRAPDARPPAPSTAKRHEDPAVLFEKVVAEVSRAEADYVKAVEELRELARFERPRWRPEVVVAFDRNLADIDAAIERQRAAAHTTPDSPVAQEALFASYKRQIDFLQEAVVRGEVEP